MNTTRRLEFAEGSSNKFWEIWNERAVVHTQYGRIGAAGQRTEKNAGSASAAEAMCAKLIADKLKKGYRDVNAPTPTATKAGKQLPAASTPAATKPARASSLPAATKPAATFDDVRAAAFELAAENGHDSLIAELISHLVVWAVDATDEQVTRWIAALPKGKEGWCSQAAGRVAVQRALAGDRTSAAKFLAIAETAAPKKDRHAISNAMHGLIPAWWRLGEHAKASKAYAEQLAGEPHSQGREKLARIAAMGGQVDRFIEHGRVGAIVCPEEGEGLVALFIDGPEVLAKALNNVQDVDGSDDLTIALARHTLRTGKPELFLEMTLKFPRVFASPSECTELALVTLASTAPTAAVKLALRMLDNDDVPQSAHVRAASILAQHAPKEAERWAQTAPIAKDPGYSCHSAVLAALGKTAAARKLVANDDWNHKAQVACLSMDRGLALEALRAAVADRNFRPCAALLQLCDFGEQSVVDAYFEQQLALLAPLSPKDRDLKCRPLAMWAGAVGRVDVGTKFAKAPSKGLRHLSARELMAGCVSVGDHPGALAALALIDEPRDKSAAMMSCLRAAAEAFATGPRALPPVCLQTTS